MITCLKQSLKASPVRRTHHAGCTSIKLPATTHTYPASDWLLCHTTHHFLFTPRTANPELFVCQLSMLSSPDLLDNLCLSSSRSPLPLHLAAHVLQTWEFLFAQEVMTHGISNTCTGLPVPQHSWKWPRPGLPP